MLIESIRVRNSKGFNLGALLAKIAKYSLSYADLLFC